MKAFAIVAVVLYFACPVSCSVSTEGINLCAIDYTTPKLMDYEVTGAENISMRFSGSVDFEEVRLYPDGIEATVQSSVDSQTGQQLSMFTLASKMMIGKSYAFCGTAVDRNGNSLSFSIPVTGFNSSIPQVEITEVHPMYTSGTSKGEKYYKCEYVELCIKQDGNMAGLLLYGAKDGVDKGFVFPALEVKAGEIIVVHFRMKGDGCINETGSDIALASTRYSSDSARDLWVGTDAARLGDEEDCIMLKNGSNGKVLDCVAYSKLSNEQWSNQNVLEGVNQAVLDGAWPSVLLEDAVRFDSITATKVLSKIKTSVAKENSCANWQLSATSGENPGVLFF